MAIDMTSLACFLVIQYNIIRNHVIQDPLRSTYKPGPETASLDMG